jgi:hypothetical protein
MTRCRIPPEMVDAVIDNLNTDGDRKALRACAQVCHAWLPLSQRHLFRRIKFGEGAARSTRLGQVMLSSPHLAKYVRRLEVRLHVAAAFPATCHTLSVMLGALSGLRRLSLYGLAWERLTVDLRRSLRRLFLLSELRFVTLDGARFRSMDELVDLLRHAEGVKELRLCLVVLPPEEGQEILPQGDQEDQQPEHENENELRLTQRERTHLTRLGLKMNTLDLEACADRLLGPRSPLEVSHIQTLSLEYLDFYGADAFNRLLRAIGGSLTYLHFPVPDQRGDTRE